uniref:Secreted protein n=1 Tax=Octopus bimaculoides TaxID=37653 RepID=A0A0L8H9F5_OCTBM
MECIFTFVFVFFLQWLEDDRPPAIVQSVHSQSFTSLTAALVVGSDSNGGHVHAIIVVDGHPLYHFDPIDHREGEFASVTICLR